jgi:hypothetical protein
MVYDSMLASTLRMSLQLTTAAAVTTLRFAQGSSRINIDLAATCCDVCGEYMDFALDKQSPILCTSHRSVQSERHLDWSIALLRA